MMNKIFLLFSINLISFHQTTPSNNLESCFKNGSNINFNETSIAYYLNKEESIENLVSKVVLNKSEFSFNNNSKIDCKKVKLLSTHLIKKFENENITPKLLNDHLKRKRNSFQIKSLNENYEPILKYQNKSPIINSSLIPIIYVKYSDPLKLKFLLNNSLLSYNYFLLIPNFNNKTFYEIKQFNESNLCVDNSSQSLFDADFNRSYDVICKDTKISFNNKSINNEFLFDVLLVLLNNQSLFSSFR